MTIQYSPDELQRVDDIIRRNDIRFIRLQFSDIVGIAKHVTIPVAHWDNVRQPGHLVRRQLGGGLCRV